MDNWYRKEDEPALVKVLAQMLLYDLEQHRLAARSAELDTMPVEEERPNSTVKVLTAVV